MIKMAQFSHPLFEPYSLVYFIFTFQELQNSKACGSPFTLCSALWNKYLLTCQKWHFQACWHGYPFLCKICELLVYDILRSQFDIDLAPAIPWTVIQQNGWWNFPNTQFNPPLQLDTREYMYSPVSNCKGGLNCVFGKFDHPFCLIRLYNLLEFGLKTA